ncbi:DUF1828 domain-containing protein [Novosphingobium sp. YJ-S2-02]|uniref:DUF1828 domain-containing protein n=1 Tax=Novosphingobium aureum TaxID=2792964 RepID=A0A931HB66_9SPHN|nr:DUF1828 domain-containing protein [Novosphingobium aureum]MBH0112741.1 DUF1828 domain-containing protein [Novosphingobium aureum]
MTGAFEKELCAAFCGGLEVHPVGVGYAVSTAFRDNSGDRLSFYIETGGDGFDLVDGGDYLPELVARDIHIAGGTRGDLLNAILSEAGAYWDRETYEIRADGVAEADLAVRSIQFLSALIRVRDLSLITKDRVKSAFREDFIREVTARYGEEFEIEESAPPTKDLEEFPADVVLRSINGGRPGAIYLVNNSDKLNEALLAWQEVHKIRADVAMVAVIEDNRMTNINKMKFQRAQNRRLPMPIFRGGERDTVEFIADEMRTRAA